MADVSKIKLDNNTYDIKDVKARTSNIYSETETEIGTWLGHTLYRKVINFGALPNNTEKQVATGLTGCLIVNVYGISNYTSNNATQTPIPYVDCSDLTKSMLLIVRDYGTKVGIKTAMNYSAFSAYIVVEYYKL